MTQFSDTQEYRTDADESNLEQEHVKYGSEDVAGSENVEFIPTEDVNDLDVDSAELGGDDEVEDIEGAEAADSEKPAKAKKAAEDKTTKRGDLPEGYTTPVGLAKILTERELYRTRDGEVAELKPQMVYSYAKNAPKDNPFPAETITDSNGNERNVVKIEEGVAWWVRKNQRAEERRTNAAKKAAEKTEKAKAKESADAQVTEAEADDESVTVEAE